MQPPKPQNQSQPKITRRTRIVFEPGTPISAISDTVQSLDLPLAPKTKFASEYALAEVLFNALRVSAERGADEPVVAEIVDDNDRVNVTVQDAAGGFDLKELPYDFDARPEEIEVASEAFDRYRAEHNERRFGLGLLTTRALVEDFSLEFIDDSGDKVPWRGAGSVHGTRVQFHLTRAQKTKERRQSARRGIKGNATIAEGLKAHVCDLSPGGARMVMLSRPLPQLDEVYRANIVLEEEPPLETQVWAKIARLERVGACYDVGTQFVQLDKETRAELKQMVARIVASTRSDAMTHVRVELMAQDEKQG